MSEPTTALDAAILPARGVVWRRHGWVDRHELLPDDPDYCSHGCRGAEAAVQVTEIAPGARLITTYAPERDWPVPIEEER